MLKLWNTCLEIVELCEGVKVGGGEGAGGPQSPRQVGVTSPPARRPLQVELPGVQEGETNLGCIGCIERGSCSKCATFSGPGKGMFMGLRKTWLSGCCMAGWRAGPGAGSGPALRSRGWRCPASSLGPPSSSSRRRLNSPCSFSI